MPKKRIPPSQALSKEILELVQNLTETGNNNTILTKLIEMSIRKTIQEILEKEVTEYIGKAYYESGKNRNGYRNGYKPAHIRTAECKIPIQRPQVDDTNEPFKSKVWPHLKGNTQRLEHIAVEMYARGCSTRDIEDLLKDEYGNILLSKSAISQLNERLWQEYESFCKADLSNYDVVYIFCDAVYESLRLHKSPKEGILVTWGILSSGAKVLLSMELGNKESYDDWLQVFRNLKRRGLCDPVLGVTDGAPGLIKAFEETFPKTLRQRCLVHKKRNILSKVPQDVVSEMKVYLNTVYYAPDKKVAYIQAEAFRERFGRFYPSAIASFDDDLDACLAHLVCPAKHRKHITSTNLVERSFLEEKRRSNTIPRFFNEKSGLKLVFASLVRASYTWRKINFTFNDQMQILELRHKLGHKSIKERSIKQPKRISYAKSFLQKK